MRSLVSAELHRFWARRATRVALGALIAGVLVVSALQFLRSEESYEHVGTYSGPGMPPGDCIVTNSKSQRQMDASCFDRHPVVQLGTGPDLTWETVRVLDRRVDVVRTFESTIRGEAMALVLLAYVLGATFIAADFATSLPTQVMFEMRRVRLFAAKWCAVLIALWSFTMAVLTCTFGAQWIAGSLRGTAGAVSLGWISSRLVQAVIAASAVGLAGVIGMSFTFIVRRTAVAIGVFAGMLLLSRMVGTTSGLAKILRWSPASTLWGVAFGRIDSSNQVLFGDGKSLAACWVGVGLWVLGLAIVGASSFLYAESI